MMKNVLLFFVLLFLGIQLDAQEKPFKNFYVQQGQYDVLFILPLDFEQKFEILKSAQKGKKTRSGRKLRNN